MRNVEYSAEGGTSKKKGKQFCLTQTLYNTAKYIFMYVMFVFQLAFSQLAKVMSSKVLDSRFLGGCPLQQSHGGVILQAHQSTELKREASEQLLMSACGLKLLHEGQSDIRCSIQRVVLSVLPVLKTHADAFLMCSCGILN